MEPTVDTRKKRARTNLKFKISTFEEIENESLRYDSCFHFASISVEQKDKLLSESTVSRALSRVLLGTTFLTVTSLRRWATSVRFYCMALVRVIYFESGYDDTAVR